LQSLHSSQSSQSLDLQCLPDLPQQSESRVLSEPFGRSADELVDIILYENTIIFYRNNNCVLYKYFKKIETILLR
jgi:hypothetical protein